MGDRVELEEPRPALEGRSVQADALGQRLLELRNRDRRALEQAEHVDEPEPDETHAVLLGAAKHVVNGGRFGPQRISSQGMGRQRSSYPPASAAAPPPPPPHTLPASLPFPGAS